MACSVFLSNLLFKFVRAFLPTMRMKETVMALLMTHSLKTRIRLMIWTKESLILKTLWKRMIMSKPSPIKFHQTGNDLQDPLTSELNAIGKLSIYLLYLFIYHCDIPNMLYLSSFIICSCSSLESYPHIPLSNNYYCSSTYVP